MHNTIQNTLEKYKKNIEKISFLGGFLFLLQKKMLYGQLKNATDLWP